MANRKSQSESLELETDGNSSKAFKGVGRHGMWPVCVAEGLGEIGVRYTTRENVRIQAAT